MRPALNVIEGALPNGAPTRGRRLREIGAQTARVAHELKVPLSLVDGSLQTLEQYAAAAGEYIAVTAADGGDGLDSKALQSELDLAHLAEHAPALFDICREGTRRLRALIEQLEDYAAGGSGAGARRLLDLGQLLRQASVLAGCSRPNTPPIDGELAGEWWVYGDAHGLSRAFINLLTNAFDAVGETVRPRVAVTLSPSVGSANEEAGVEVRVRDNGPGVSAALHAHIFEPFFTTKSRRSGLGLGLAIAKEIVEQHGGTIALAVPERDAGDAAIGGAEFIVRLPVADLTRG